MSTVPGTLPDDALAGVAPGAELWDVGGRVFLVYTVPGTDIRLGWHVTTLQQLSALGGEGITKTLSRAEAQSQGFVDFGVRTSLVQFSQDPFEAFTTEFERQARVLPMLQDPEVAKRAFGAFLEGRPIDISDIADTDYWKTRTPEQREWDTFVVQQGGAQSPAVQQRLESNRIRVRNSLIQAGWPDQNPPDSLINRLADNLTTGVWDDTQLADAIRQQVDPSAPGASPFAGRPVAEGAASLRTSDGTFVRTPDGRFVRVDDETAARFSDLGELGAAGDRNVEASGDAGQIKARVAAIRRNAGLPDDPDSDQVWVDRVLGGSHTLADARLRINEKAIQTLGASDDAESLFGAMPEGRTALGGEEDVLALLNHWLGPRMAALYDQTWIAEWAGRIRNNPDAREQLVDTLRAARQEHFPHWSEELAYADRVPFYRQQYAQAAGFLPNEQTDDFFLSLMQQQDQTQLASMLRQQGLDEGWEPVVTEAFSGLLRQVGGTARQVV